MSGLIDPSRRSHLADGQSDPGMIDFCNQLSARLGAVYGGLLVETEARRGRRAYPPVREADSPQVSDPGRNGG
jgi:hypothetical protein